MAEKPKCEIGDEMKVGPIVDDHGGRLVVRHTADHQVKIGVVRPAPEGKPVHGEIFTVEPKDGEDDVYRVTSAMRAAGPAKVNSPAFHDGWERTFGGRKPPVGQA